MLQIGADVVYLAISKLAHRQTSFDFQIAFEGLAQVATVTLVTFVQETFIGFFAFSIFIADCICNEILIENLELKMTLHLRHPCGNISRLSTSRVVIT